MLEYRFPKREVEVDTISSMSPDKVARLRDTVKFRLEGLLKTCDDYFDNLIESTCRICGKEDVGHFSIPDGWGWVGETGYLLCNSCIDKWEIKFGEKPKLSKGEVEYEHGTISEDSAHRGQANYRLVFGRSRDN